MADVSKRFGKGKVSNNSDATVYTVPTGKRAFLKAATLCNPNSTDTTVTILLAGVAIVFSHKLKAYDTITIPFLDQIFESGEKLEVLSVGTNGFNYYFSGREVDV